MWHKGFLDKDFTLANITKQNLEFTEDDPDADVEFIFNKTLRNDFLEYKNVTQFFDNNISDVNKKIDTCASLHF